MHYEIQSSFSFGVFGADGDDVTHMPRPTDKLNRVFVGNSESASQIALPLTFCIMRSQMTAHCKVLLSPSVPSRRSMIQDNQKCGLPDSRCLFFCFFAFSHVSLHVFSKNDCSHRYA